MRLTFPGDAAMSSVAAAASALKPRRSQAKLIWFAIFFAVTIFVTYMKNAKVFDPSSDMARHFSPGMFFLVPHAIFASIALVMGAFQFSNRLRARSSETASRNGIHIYRLCRDWRSHGDSSRCQDHYAVTHRRLSSSNIWMDVLHCRSAVLHPHRQYQAASPLDVPRLPLRLGLYGYSSCDSHSAHLACRVARDRDRGLDNGRPRRSIANVFPGMARHRAALASAREQLNPEHHAFCWSPHVVA